ncbi:AraC family transcriptional regulator [Paenibacillus sp. MER TA 81-3]|uniref:helix-turn-helix transcriptional regulator n=1 Tax=Paenibacillus sp. MER TA 81-3 TaxID=2939573 RepID=UPI00203A8C9D|nr:AraC family transcriptional regulator [Paenibacillus sp. MER TA 81-3]MCM3340404.1 AraC family transcriptional regulator [Paenibacillus sp. MER TA 81-3]
MDSLHFPMLTDKERTLPLIVTTVGSWSHQTEIDRPHGYPDYQWLQCTSGRGIFRWEGHEETIEISSGQGVLLFPDVPHEYKPVEEPWGIYWFGFQGALAQELLCTVNIRQSLHMTLRSPDITMDPIRRALALLSDSAYGQGTVLSSLAYELVMAWGRCGWADTGKAGRQPKQGIESLAPLLDWIHEHYMKEVTLQQMADRINISPQYVCTLFRRSMGFRPLQYVNRLRIRKSMQLLMSQPELFVSEIGNEVGFQHASYFIQRFKQQEGMTPAQFRQLHGGIAAREESLE